MPPVESIVPSSGRDHFRNLVLRVARFWIPLTLVSFGLCVVAMIRIGRIDPTRVAAGAIGDVALPALAVAMGGMVLGLLLDQLIGRIGELGRWIVRRLRPDDRPPESREKYETTQREVTRALLVLVGTWAAFKWLVVPLTVAGRNAVHVPMIGASAGSLLIPFSIGLGLEVLLGLVRLIQVESRSWWLARALLRVAWIGFLIVVIAGSNLLIGDPLEWASSIGPAPLSVEWIEAAPRVMASAWPLVQVALAGTLVWQLLSLSREVPRIWRRT